MKFRLSVIITTISLVVHFVSGTQYSKSAKRITQYKSQSPQIAAPATLETKIDHVPDEIFASGFGKSEFKNMLLVNRKWNDLAKSRVLLFNPTYRQNVNQACGQRVSEQIFNGNFFSEDQMAVDILVGENGLIEENNCLVLLSELCKDHPEVVVNFRISSARELDRFTETLQSSIDWFTCSNSFDFKLMDSDLDSFQYLANSLSRNINLLYLDLSKVKLTKQSLELLTPALIPNSNNLYNDNVQSLIVNTKSISDDECLEYLFLHFIPSSTHLNELSLIGFVEEFPDRYFLSFEMAIISSGLSQSPHLKLIRFKRFALERSGVNVLLETLGQLPQLTVLDLGISDLSLNYTHINFLTQSQSLRILNITSSLIEERDEDEEVVVELQGSLLDDSNGFKLEELHLYYTSVETMEVFTRMMQDLRKNTNLKKLVLFNVLLFYEEFYFKGLYDDMLAGLTENQSLINVQVLESITTGRQVEKLFKFLASQSASRFTYFDFDLSKVNEHKRLLFANYEISIEINWRNYKYLEQVLIECAVHQAFRIHIVVLRDVKLYRFVRSLVEDEFYFICPSRVEYKIW